MKCACPCVQHRSALLCPVSPAHAQCAFCGTISRTIFKQTGKTSCDKDERDELERLRRENAALKKGASPGARVKVSEKGALSIYGMGRFPVTLYKEQWLKLLDMSDEIRAFIAANEAQLKAKD